MKKYDDKKNVEGVYIIFAVFQMVLLAVMYTIVYAAYRATELSVEKYELNAVTAFAPSVIVFLAIPFVLFRTRKMFRAGRMMEAILWMMALLSIFLVGLLMHVSNISQI
ncbi:MAG: Unknown protein [uncultured Sulfurovum sp.]|uniref:Uncharacterized protein n=1 Tax=uncultured Sulfurovum sp. TaxID=269237 RepID=A0A6S6SSV7_9BACT|nr:MAG: Unknown protein [uncultured Sulfurovum sp.]